MCYDFEYRSYKRKFVRPLQTSHGVWDTRQGIILRLTDENGNVAWGEIAPISWFASEDIEEALVFCEQLSGKVTSDIIFSIPDKLPACQFGFESALEMMSNSHLRAKSQESLFPITCSLPYSALLPAGKVVLQQWQNFWDNGYRTFKWKIGVYPIAEELEIFALLIKELPASAKLRLDANAGLSSDEAIRWLTVCDDCIANNFNIEYIEQLLPVANLQEMLELANLYHTKLALDESVANLQQLTECYQQGWRDIFVIKPLIFGSPSKLRQFCQKNEIDAVFSSVFETHIGQEAALQLAVELSRSPRAVGFGVNHFFDDSVHNFRF